MGKFGWSYPPGVESLPWEDDPGPPIALKCPRCGCFVPMEPIKTEYVEDRGIDLDGNEVVYWADEIKTYKCTHCGREAQDTCLIPVYP